MIKKVIFLKLILVCGSKLAVNGIQGKENVKKMKVGQVTKGNGPKYVHFSYFHFNLRWFED